MKDALGDRMKAYENVSRIYLPKRMPLIIRLDGRAWHTLTRGFQKPFDHMLMEAMQETALELCKNIEGAKLAYTQSDEISILLTDYETITTEPWFGKNLQKIVSVATSMVTLYFNRIWNRKVYEEAMHRGINDEFDSKEAKRIYNAHVRANGLGAQFDARVWVLPKEEVCNYFIWRQQDATRNSISMVAQAYFSHKELEGVKSNEKQDKLMLEKGVNWNNFTTPEKRGSCVTKDGVKKIINFQTGEEKERKIWQIDYDIPIFTKDRNYIERFV